MTDPWEQSEEDVVRTRPQAEEENVKAVERERLLALVQCKIQRAAELHADDFQLINPRGESLSKSEYLGRIASGDIRYIRWDPEDIVVHVEGDTAVIRYRSALEIEVRGERTPLHHYWHIDWYRRRSGQWQVVWSQATLIERQEGVG